MFRKSKATAAVVTIYKKKSLIKKMFCLRIPDSLIDYSLEAFQKKKFNAVEKKFIKYLFAHGANENIRKDNSYVIQNDLIRNN